MTGVHDGPAPLRVLLVDDEPDVRFLLQIQMRLAGFDVIGTAANGAEAMDSCRRDPPDVVVLDLLMPTVNGFETIGMLQEELPDVGIVAYTGVAGEFVRAEMERLGVEVVLKAGDSLALADAVRRCVKRESSDPSSEPR